MRRSGQGSPSSGAVVVSQPQPPSPAAAAIAPTVKLRRVRRRISCSAATPVSEGGCCCSGMVLFLHWDQLIAGDHRTEIVPPGPDDLTDVDDKEEHITDRQPEVFRPRPGVAAQ